MEAKIYPLLTALFEIPLIQAYQNGREPLKPFAVYALRWEKLPTHFIHQTDGQAVHSHAETVLELQVFGDDALNLLKRLVLRLKLPSVLERWAQENMAIVEIGQVTSMPFLNEAKQYEARAIVEIRLRYSLSLEDPIPFFNRVEVENLDTHQIHLIGEQTNGKD